MAEVRYAKCEGDLYERLLQRLALALEQADITSSLPNDTVRELELVGLTAAELELIHAYLEGDLQWLRGWHAAAEELMQIQREPLISGKLIRGRVIRAGGLRVRRRTGLFCALCGAPVSWCSGQESQACQACGSRLFRAG